jgi:hypothetical protein
MLKVVERQLELHATAKESLNRKRVPLKEEKKVEVEELQITNCFF